VNASGEPLLIGNVSLRPSAETGLPRVQTAPISAGGFTLRNVPPGRYVLQAQGVPNTMGSLKGQPANESGRIDISVDGLAQSDVVVTTSKGATLRGRVVRDGDTQQPLGTIGVVAMSTVQRTAGPGVVTEVAADGTFELRGVHDASVFRIANSTNGWDLKTVLLRGTDVTDKPTQLGPDEVIEGVEVHLSNRLPRLSITLTSRPSGRDAGGGVIVFSTDSSRWGARSRFVKTVQLDETGAGEVGGLVPGQYFVAMVDYDDTPAATDPKFLERMKAQAMTVSLRDGETKQVSLSTRSAR